MGIRKTYHDGNPEDRAWIDDFWSWLKDQPQDAWLLWARNANWDNADTVFETMLDDPRCDLALVSFIFWGAGPGFSVRNPGHYGPGDLVHRIVTNVERGLYCASTLHLDRYTVIHNAQDYIAALRETSPRPAPFRLPRALCGPFDGREATLPARYDAETELDLAEIFEAIDGELPRSEQAYRHSEEAGGNLWIKERLRLPVVPADPVSALAALDDAAYAEAIFGTSAQYEAARRAETQRGKKGWWPFS